MWVRGKKGYPNIKPQWGSLKTQMRHSSVGCLIAHNLISQQCRCQISWDVWQQQWWISLTNGWRCCSTTVFRKQSHCETGKKKNSEHSVVNKILQHTVSVWSEHFCFRLKPSTMMEWGIYGACSYSHPENMHQEHSCRYNLQSFVTVRVVLGVITGQTQRTNSFTLINTRVTCTH